VPVRFRNSEEESILRETFCHTTDTKMNILYESHKEVIERLTDTGVASKAKDAQNVLHSESNGKRYFCSEDLEIGQDRIQEQRDEVAENESHSFIPKRQKRKVSTDLCEECAELDIDTIFSRAESELSMRCDQTSLTGGNLIKNKGIIVASLGNRLAQADKLSCQLCRLLASTSFPSKESENYHLWAFPSAWGCDFMKTISVPRKLLCGSTPFLAAIPDFSYQGLHDTPSDNQLRLHWKSHGYIFRTVATEANPRGIWGREISPCVNFTSSMEWFQFCRKHHRGSCVRPRTHHKETLQGFRLIDCNIEEIVSCSWTEAYAALSYVWGSVEDKEATWPRVVRHAILVTRALGLKYLWVDRYCINQNNPSQRHDQISKMNLIYEGAEITIINAAGSNAESGLPGIENEPRPLQPKVKIGNTVLVSTMCSPRVHISNSVWSTRGWTYQEGVLSRRRLVFTGEQMYFECGAMAVCETVLLPLVEFHAKSLRCFRSFVEPGIFSGKASFDSFHSESDGQAKLYELDRHSVKYSSRSLSYPMDSLNAFSGILNRYCSQSKGQIQAIFGLLVRLGSYPQLVGSFALSICTWGHILRYEINLQEFSCFRRLPHFPSWTWVGWQGEISWACGDHGAGDWQVFEWLGTGAKHFIADISLRLLDGRSLDDVEKSRWANFVDQISPFFVIRKPYVLKEIKLRNDHRYNGSWMIFDIQIPHWGSFSAKPPTTIDSTVHRSPTADNSQWEFILMLEYTRKFQSEKRNYKIYYFLIVKLDNKLQECNSFVGHRVGCCIAQRVLKDESEFEKLLIHQDYTVRVE